MNTRDEAIKHFGAETIKKIDAWILDRFGEGHQFNTQLLWDFLEWVEDQKMRR